MERFEDDYYEDYYDYEYDEKGNIIGFKTKPKSPSNQPPVSQQPPGTQCSGITAIQFVPVTIQILWYGEAILLLFSVRLLYIYV